MKGKRLYALLKNLDRSERLQLHHQCIKSSDKRHAVLKDLLDSRVDSIESFESVLNKTAAHFENYPDSAKALRRFIDFASKEIENILIVNYLEANADEKNFILAKIFNNRNSQELFLHYNESAKTSAHDMNKLWMLSELSDHKTKWLSRGQMKDDMQALRILLNQKYQFDQLNYYQQLFQYYSTFSALYLDDISIISEHQLEIIILELKDLSEKSPTLFFKAQFLLALARFNFRNKSKLDNSLREVQNIISQLKENETEFERVLRSFYYISILAGIYYGEDLQNLIYFSDEVIRINIKHNYKDSVSYFLNIMFLQLNKDFESAEALRKKYDKNYFDESNQSYSDFLDALYLFLNGSFDAALDILNSLSYDHSEYVSLWSRLMVIKIHSCYKNDRLLKILLSRTNKHLKDHKEMFFLNTVSAEILKTYSINNSNNATEKYFELFRLLCADIKLSY